MAEWGPDDLRDAATALDALTDTAVLDGLEATLARWTGDNGLAHRAARDLGDAWGASPDMIRFGLERMVRAHPREALAGWLASARAEAGWPREDPQPHPQPQPHPHPHPQPQPQPQPQSHPQVAVQVLAGNLAGLALPVVLEALLSRTAVLLKPAAEEQVTPILLKQSLDEAAPVLGRAVVVRYWAGGDREIERAVFARADSVIGWGGASLAAGLAAGEPRALLHGPRYSVGLVGPGWAQAPPEWFAEVAREMALWDQRGCLSPRVLCVAGDRVAFSGRLASAMVELEERWPARPRMAGDASAVHAFRARYELAGEDAALFVPADTTWTVATDAGEDLKPGPPARVVRVIPLPSREEALAQLTAHAHALQGVGLAFLDSGWEDLAQRAGIPHVAELTRIQDPPAGWAADGRSDLVHLLRNKMKPLG